MEKSESAKEVEPGVPEKVDLPLRSPFSRCTAFKVFPGAQSARCLLTEGHPGQHVANPAFAEVDKSLRQFQEARRAEEAPKSCYSYAQGVRSAFWNIQGAIHLANCLVRDLQFRTPVSGPLWKDLDALANSLSSDRAWAEKIRAEWEALERKE